ncbi:MAG: 2TM domain-containing protein [Planctomycetaceae bacterium]
MATRAEAENRAQLGFWIHVGVYVIVVSSLAALNLTRNPEKLWFLWVLGGWGIGVAFHALSFFALPEARERIIARTMDRMNRREHAHRRHP